MAYRFRRLLLSAVIASSVWAEEWTRFRGPNGTGVDESANPPVVFGAGKNVVWKTEVAFGRSSPVLARGVLYVTGSDERQLLVMAMDAASGKVKWKREIPRARKQVIYRSNDVASPSPVTDGRNVYVFFAELGLISFTAEGKERWRVPLGPFDSFYGMAASPVLHGGVLYQVCDQRTGSFLIAVDAETGKTRWKVDRSAGGFEAFATPIVHKGELIVQGSFRVEGYAAASGERLWWVRRQGYNPKGTPVVIGDALIVSAPGSDEPQYPAFDAVVATYDVNKDGRMSRDEVKANADMYEHWGALDSNGDGYASRHEYEVIRMLGVGDYGMVAVQLGGRGDLTERAIRWRDKRAYPNVPSPLAYRGVLYSVKNGGIVTTHNPENGSVFKTGRAANALGDYWSSPVAAAGRVYVASAAGKVVVLAAKPEWEVLAVNDVEDEIFATPLPAGERLYVRTRGAVYCFGEKQ